ncbi:MAG: SDR family NAD(P)-dependent oxidoreductase [Solirubrobacterales bacterium]
MPDTALVTGASSGLGEEFARQLSDRGYELILAARRVDRLEKLAGELPTKAAVVECDLASEAAALQSKVERLGTQVDLLVNNAGFGTHDRFLEIERGRDAEMVRVNCEAVVILTRDFLPAMVERGSGGVITVASTAGMNPLPYETVYSASKAFALTFSDALAAEVKGTGVKILAVNPGPVKTEWQEVAGFDDWEKVPGTIPAEKCVAQALRAYERGKRSVIPGFVIRQVMRSGKLVPRGIWLRAAERTYRPE